MLVLLSGVTLIRPEDLDFPSTMTDIQFNTWMLRYSVYTFDLLLHNY